MGFLKLLLNIGLILTTSTVFCIDDIETDYRLPNNTIPVHYKIKLTPYLEEGNFTFYGESNVKIEIRVASPKISLHSKELEINETATTLIKNDGTIYKPTEHIYSDETNILTLNFENALSSNFYTLNMKFTGNLSEISTETGFLKIPYTDKAGNNKWLAATYFEPNGARQMFPCWDEPALKATFDISVMHHQKYEVLSNMPIREQFTEQDGMVWTHFDTTPIMSTYLVAIIVMSDFVRISNADQTINVWSSSFLIPQINFARSIAEKVTPFLTEYTNTTAIVPKIDHVLVQSYSVDGMENWGLIIYNGLKIIYNGSTDPTFKRIPIAQIIAHEIAHQWFGNLVTPSWWSHLWLSEGFATFFHAYVFNKIFQFKNWLAMEFLVIENLHGSFSTDIGLMNSVTFKYTDATQAFTAVYRKASVLLRMLYHIITDEVFRKGIITYLRTYQFSSTTPDDLWSTMQSALDKSDVPHEGYRVKEVMDSWINQKRYPVVNVVKNYETGEVTISQECFRGQEVEECINTTWWIPVTFATQSNPNFSNTMPIYWLRPNQNISFRIDPNDWIILNIQQTGYYRVNYDTRNWEKLANYLNTDMNYMNIHVLNRAQIINDLFVFVRDGQINGKIFYNLINFLKRDTDYITWYPMFQIIKWWKNTFSLPESRYIKFHLVGLLGSLLEEIGYDESSTDDDITKMKRRDALKWACTVDHGKCKEIAADKLSKHLADPDTHKIPEWWQEWTYCAGLMAANKTTWNKMLELYQQKSDIMILKSLSCAEDPAIIHKYLNFMASNASLFNIRIHYLAFIFIAERHASNDLILDYILENIVNIRPELVPISITLSFLLSHVSSDQQIEKVRRHSQIYLNFNEFHNFQQAVEKRREDRDRTVHNYIKQFVEGVDPIF